MKRSFLQLLVPLAVCLAPVLARAQPGPAIGAPAPTIRVSRWLRGTPVTAYEKGRVYVVEFWSTWCGPCKDAMPHLSELSRKYAGKVTFVGVDVWEKNYPGKTIDQQVDACVTTGAGKAMTYNVAQDTADGFMDKNWLKPYAQNGIPATFVIDQSGNVAWIGHPMNLEKILGEVTAGTYDTKPAAAQFARMLAVANGDAALIDPIKEELAAKRWEMALNLIDRAVAQKPALAPRLAERRAVALVHVDEERFRTEATAALKATGEPAKWYGQDRGWPQARDVYGQMAAAALEEGLTRQTYLFLIENLEVARTKVQVSDGHSYATYLDGLANDYVWTGDKAKALTIADELVNWATNISKQPGWTDRFVKLKARLEAGK